MSAEVFISLHLQLCYLFMVSFALALWVCGLPNGKPTPPFGHPSQEGIFLDLSRNLFGLGVGELDVSGEEEERECNTDGDEGGENEVEPHVSNADAPSFDDHKHRGCKGDKQQIVGERSRRSIDVGGIHKIHEGIIGLLHEGDVINPGGW